MTKNNSFNKLDRNYDQTNTKLLSTQRKRRSKSQVTSNKTQDPSIKNGVTPRNSARRKKLCEPSALPASTGNQDIVVNSSSTETTTDSTSTICKEKFLDKLDLHVKPKVKISHFFTCDFCDEDFLTQNYLDSHVFRAHKDIIACKQTSKVSSNSNHKTKLTLVRDKVHRYVPVPQRYGAANTQLNKFNTRFISKVSEERKRRRKLFREQIQMNKSRNKSTGSSTKMSEVEDKSNLQMPTSTVEIDESSKDNPTESPTSTSDINEYKSKSKRFIHEFEEFVRSNGDVISLSDTKQKNDSKEISSLLSDDSLTFETPDRKSGQRKVGNNSAGLKTPDNVSESPTATSPPPPPRPEKPRTYNRKKSPKANKKNTKDHGYCDSCTRSLAMLDTRYQTDSCGNRKIHCQFCSHKFVSVNGLFRHVALYHLNCTCIRNKCHWYSPFSVDANQLDSAAASKTYRCNYCSKDYDDYRKYNFHHYSFHELEPVSDELVEKAPKYLKDMDSNVIVKSWVPSARKTNFFGKKLNNDEYDEDYDNDNGDFLPLVCQKCGELYFNGKEYTIHLDSCYYQLDLTPVTPITQYPEESRSVEELRESSLKPESNRRIDFVVRPNIKLQFFPQDVKTKPRNPRKIDSNYDLLRRTCRRCNKPFASVKELSLHYQDVHGNSANNNTNNSNKNNNNNGDARGNGTEKTPSADDNAKTKKDYDDENNITYYNYKNTPWYGHNVRHKWQCVHCKLSFKIFRAFSNHLFFEHNDESLIHICENCDEILTNLDQINKHLCVNVTVWSCKLCDLKFDSGFEFRTHNTQNHYELFEPSVCLACGKKFLTHYMLMRHMKNKKCSSEKIIDDLISTYTKKHKKGDPVAPRRSPVKKKKENKEPAGNIIIILDEAGDKVESKENEKNVEGAADEIFESVDCSGDNLVSELEPDGDSRKTDALATTDVAEERIDVIGDKVEEAKKQVPGTEGETMKESMEETTNDEDNVAEEEGFDDAPMDDDSVIEDTNDEDSDDGSGDDDDDDDEEDFDDEDLDDEELDDEEFDDDESADILDSDDLETSEHDYNELVKINDNCRKIIDIDEDTYDELEGIKNYVLENDKKSVDSASSKRTRIDESLANKRKKLSDIHDSFVAQVDELNDQGKIKKGESENRSAGTSRKGVSQVNRCSMCKLQFPSMTLLSNHFNRTHTSAVEVCQLCFKMYITGNLVKHMVKDHFRSDTDFADALVVMKDEINIERDTRDFISIVGKIHLLALCKYQEPPQASSEESVDCSDCSLTFENADKYRMHNVEVHDKFCALCIAKFRNGQEAAKHKLEVHGSTACYVWFASKMINAIDDTDTFKEAVGLKAKKRKPKNFDEGYSNNNKSITRSNSRNININVNSNINIDNNVNINMINNMSVKQETITLKDKILDILRKSQPTLDRLNSQIHPTRTEQQQVVKQTNKPQGVSRTGKRSDLQESSSDVLDVKTPKMMIKKTPVKTDKSTKVTRNQRKVAARQSLALNQVAIKNKKVEELPGSSQVYDASDDESIIITCGLLKKENGQDSNEDEKQFLIVVKKNDLRKYRNNLRELAAQFVASTNMSREEMVRLLQAELDNI